MKKILLLEADYTQSLPTVKSLVKKGYNVDGIFSSKLSYGYGSKYFKKKYLFKDTGAFELYRDFILEILKIDKYDAVIPMNDESAIVLSKYKDLFIKYTNYDLPEWKDFERGYDKHKLMEECRIGNYPHPKTITINGADIRKADISNINFPILIKPNYSSGARGITLINSPQELYEKFKNVYEKYGECHIQEFIPKGGAQVEVQLYIDKNGDLIQSSVIHKFRWYPNNGGSSCCNKSIDNDKIVKNLHGLLKQIGWVGLADFDTIEDPRTGELLIMELNPRLPACIKTAYASGIDWADTIISQYLNKPHQIYNRKRDVFLRHLGFEILWLINNKSIFGTKPNWFNFIGKNVFYQDMNGWRDPLTFIYGTYGNLKKQLSKEFRDSKKGVTK